MSHREKKDLDSLAILLAHLNEAEKVARTLSPQTGRFADATIGNYSLSQAIERFKSLHATLHVAVHNTLPENK
jgi:hypothetical protein